MEKQRDIKILTIIALITSILCLTVALATVSSTIKQKEEIDDNTGYIPIIPEENKQTTTKQTGIKTTTRTSNDVGKQESIWSVGFKNLSTPILKGTTKVEKGFSLKNNSTVIEGLNVIFSSSNDSVIYTFDVVNHGNVDAKISSLVKINPTCSSVSNIKDDETYVCNNIKYTLNYTENNIEVKKDDVLNAKSSRNLTLKIEYIGKELPVDKVEIGNLSIVIIYVQK